MKVVIIEDEDLTRKMLVNYVKNHNALEFIAEADSVKGGIQLLNACKPDLLMLDIQLKDGMSFEILTALEYQPRIIFITAYKEYAIKALKLGALDYVLKPIDFEELDASIERIQEQAILDKLQIQELKTSFKEPVKRIVLKTLEGVYVVNFEDIMYVQSNGAYSQFYLSNDKIITLSKNIKEYEQILPPDMFFRCHNSFLVNLNFVTKISRDNEIILKNNQPILVSIRKRDELIERFNRF
jgi:two-component system, LytTR family, response regulator